MAIVTRLIQPIATCVAMSKYGKFFKSQCNRKGWLALLTSSGSHQRTPTHAVRVRSRADRVRLFCTESLVGYRLVWCIVLGQSADDPCNLKLVAGLVKVELYFVRCWYLVAKALS